MSQSIRLGSALLLRASTRRVQAIPRRAFTVTATTQQPDIVANLFLDHLSKYKAPPADAKEAEQSTKKFNMPATPKSPEETNLASEMNDYENQVVEIEGQAATGETQQSPEEDYFEDLKQFDEQPASSGGH